MSYVNANGDPIDIEAMKASARQQRRSSRLSRDVYHKGWSVTGFSPEDIERARLQHEEVAAKNLTIGRPTPAWSEQTWMRNARPSKVRAKPYETQGAAEEAKVLAERYGWKNVAIASVAKGQA